MSVITSITVFLWVKDNLRGNAASLWHIIAARGSVGLTCPSVTLFAGFSERWSHVKNMLTAWKVEKGGGLKIASAYEIHSYWWVFQRALKRLTDTDLWCTYAALWHHASAYSMCRENDLIEYNEHFLEIYSIYHNKINFLPNENDTSSWICIIHSLKVKLYFMVIICM